MPNRYIADAPRRSRAGYGRTAEAPRFGDFLRAAVWGRRREGMRCPSSPPPLPQRRLVSPAALSARTLAITTGFSAGARAPVPSSASSRHPCLLRGRPAAQAGPACGALRHPPSGQDGRHRRGPFYPWRRRPSSLATARGGVPPRGGESLAVQAFAGERAFECWQCFGSILNATGRAFAWCRCRRTVLPAAAANERGGLACPSPSVRVVGLFETD